MYRCAVASERIRSSDMVHFRWINSWTLLVFVLLNGCRVKFSDSVIRLIGVIYHLTLQSLVDVEFL